MKRITVIVCLLTLFSCQDKVICPAFQSTYILDDSTRNAYFSYVWQLDENTRNQVLAQRRSRTNPDDSLNVAVVQQPTTDYYAYAGEKVVPWRIQKKTKYGIIKNVPYPIKKYRMRTAPMENVLAPEPVSNEFVAQDFADASIDSLAVAMDSLTIDSTAVAAIPVEEPEEEEGPRFLYGYDVNDNFNVEQQYYNKYFSQQLVDTRPRPKPAPIDTTATALPDSLQTTKEPLFKGLFKKKNRSEEEVEDPVETPTEEPVENTEEGTTEEEGGNGG